MSFSAQVVNFGKNSNMSVNKFKRGVALKLFSAVVLDTPVDTGRLRANWRFSKQQAAIGSTEQVDPSGAATLSEITTGIASSKVGEALYLTNSLPYAHRIEFDGWSHTKAPDGMVRKNFVRIKQLIQKYFAENGGKK
jgi:hypothetical protein